MSARQSASLSLAFSIKMSLLDTITGWFVSGDDADTYAANVARQWETLIANAETAEPVAYQRAYDLMVEYYGQPAATYEERLAAARAQYVKTQTVALQDGFADGVASAPAAISAALGTTAAAFWDGLPAWLKWFGIGALVLAALHILTNAGILSARKTTTRKKKTA